MQTREKGSCSAGAFGAVKSKFGRRFIERKWPQASERHLQRSRVHGSAGMCEMSARVHAGLSDVHRRSAAVSATPSRFVFSSVGVFWPICDAINRLEVFPLTPLCRSGEINEQGADVQLFPPRPRGARVARLS